MKFEYLSPSRVELEALFVEPARIGRGYGRALIERARRKESRGGQ
ncbi:GNAT family N-acetyltransferase [Myxococcota bacterium]|nr:GNAT family N-acetyltransferase [Myxococcota bacterium]